MSLAPGACLLIAALLKTLPAAAHTAAECFDSVNQRPVDVTNCDTALQAAAEASEAARIASALAWLHALRDDARRARALIDRALTSLPGDASVLGNLGNIELLQGNYDAAIEAYSAALALDADTVTRAALYRNRALAYRGLGNYASAAEDYAQLTVLKQVLDVDPLSTPAQAGEDFIIERARVGGDLP